MSVVRDGRLHHEALRTFRHATGCRAGLGISSKGSPAVHTPIVTETQTVVPAFLSTHSSPDPDGFVLDCEIGVQFFCTIAYAVMLRLAVSLSPPETFILRPYTWARLLPWATVTQGPLCHVNLRDTLLHKLHLRLPNTSCHVPVGDVGADGWRTTRS